MIHFKSIKNKKNYFTKTLLKWMISYISVLVIPLLSCSLYYSHVYKIIKNETMVRQHLSLENVKSQFDSNINEMLSMATKLQMDDLITSLSHKSINAKDIPVQIYHLKDELSIYMATNSYLDEIYLYFPGNDYIVSSSTAYQNFYTDYMPDRYISTSGWKTLLSSASDKNYAVVTIDADEKLIFYKPLVIDHKTKSPLAIIAMEINKSKYIDILESRLLSNDFSTLFLTSENKVLLSTNIELSNFYNNSDFTSLEDSIFYASSTNTKYKIDLVDLETPGAVLFSMTELSLYNNELSTMLLILIISLVVSLLLGTVLTFYYSMINYRPLHEIMGYLKKSPSDIRDKNEYKTIKTTIIQNDLEIKAQRTQLTNSFIYKLLSGEVRLSQITPSVSEQLQLNFSSNKAFIVLLHTEDETKIDLTYFIVQNILTELFQAILPPLVFCHSQNEIAIIADTKDSVSDTEMKLEEGLKTFLTFCAKHFDLHFFISISDAFQKDDLSDAYKQATNAQEYMRLFKVCNILHYKEIPMDSHIGYLKLKSAEYLINMVLSGNLQQLHSYFEQIELDLMSNALSTEDAKSCQYFYYNISMRLKMQLDRIIPYRTLVSFWNMDRSYFEYSLKDAIRYIKDLYIRSTELITSQNTNSTDKKIQDVIQYIENNYFDANLNLNCIADHFHITPSYLSRKFREETGEQIIDYLYTIRINNSLRLINDTSLKIADIAEMIGFLNSNAFIRVFKKKKGCTPGQYNTARS